MNKKILFAFTSISCAGADVNGCYCRGVQVGKRHDGYIKLSNTPKHCWFNPLEIFRWYWFGKWAVKHPKLYKILFWKIKLWLN